MDVEKYPIPQNRRIKRSPYSLEALRKSSKLKIIASNIMNRTNHNVRANIVAKHQLKSCSDLFFMLFFGKKINTNTILHFVK